MIKEKVRNNWACRHKAIKEQEEYVRAIAGELNKAFDGLKTWTGDQIAFSPSVFFDNKAAHITAWYSRHYEIIQDGRPLTKVEHDEIKPLLEIQISNIDNKKGRFTVIIEEFCDDYFRPVFPNYDFESLCLTLVNRLAGR